MFVPKLSAPLTKAIRTTEGIVLGGLAVLSQVASYVDPSTLSHAEALKYSTISGGILAAQRGAIKIVALIKADTGISPAPLDEAALVEQLAEELAGKLGVHLPAHVVDEASLAKIVSDGVKAAGDPGTALHSVERELVSDAEEFASQPPATQVAAPAAAPTAAPVETVGQAAAPAPAPAGS